MKRILWYTVPTLVWMAFIFFLSSQQKVAIGTTYTTDFIIKKSLHMFEYAVLYFLFFRTIYGLNQTKKNVFKVSLTALILAVFFAITDEIHQTFVPTREGTIRDIFIDTIGIVIMYMGIRKIIKLSFIKKLL